jgi:signal transduction histidine kinase
MSERRRRARPAGSPEAAPKRAGEVGTGALLGGPVSTTAEAALGESRSMPKALEDALAESRRESRRAERVDRVRAGWTEALLELLRLPSTTETEIIAFAVESLATLTQSKLCFVGLVDDSEASMSGHVWSKSAMAECAVAGGEPIRFDVVGGGLWMAPISQHRVVVVNDYAAANPLKKGCPEGHVPLTRFLGVPLIRDGRTVLIAGLANKVEQFGELDQDETSLFLEGLWGVLSRNRAENATRQSNELLTAFLRRSPIYAFINAVTPTESRVLYASDNFQQMIGSPGGELTGKTMPELFPADLAAKMTADDWAVASSGEVLEVDEEFGGRSYSSIKFPIAHEGRTLLAGYTIDVTERKAAEVERARLASAIETVAGEAALDERDRLSRELHDGLAQELWLAKLKAGRLATMLRRQPEAAALVEDLTAAVDSGLADARRAVRTLRSGKTAARLSLTAVLRDDVEDFSDRFGLPVELLCGGDLPALPARTQAEILRIVHEALTNVRRHADATLVRVRVDAIEGGVSLVVRDNGHGFVPARVRRDRLGLASMRERAALVGGSLVVDTSPSDGTTVTLSVPIPPRGGTAAGAPR